MMCHYRNHGNGKEKSTTHSNHKCLKYEFNKIQNISDYKIYVKINVHGPKFSVPELSINIW